MTALQQTESVNFDFHTTGHTFNMMIHPARLRALSMFSFQQLQCSTCRDRGKTFFGRDVDATRGKEQANTAQAALHVVMTSCRDLAFLSSTQRITHTTSCLGVNWCGGRDGNVFSAA